jgi:hypothetical protein
VRSSEARLLRSLLRSASVQSVSTLDPSWCLPESGAPADHLRFYRNPAHLEAFAFLGEPKASASGGEPGEGMRVEELSTELVTAVDGLPAVAYARHEAWTELRWGRASIAGGNPWPHPLA